MFKSAMLYGSPLAFLLRLVMCIPNLQKMGQSRELSCLVTLLLYE